MLAGEADDQSADALGFLFWAYLTLENNHTDPSGSVRSTSLSGWASPRA